MPVTLSMESGRHTQLSIPAGIPVQESAPETPGLENGGSTEES